MLPHIANFDDFDPLEREPRVRLRYVEAGDELCSPDLIILPGTKSTVADLAYLKEIGLDDRIRRQAAQGCPLIAICGGYQMLGRSIHDPDKIESATPLTTGLGLLAVTTRFSPVKSTHQVKARTLIASGILAKARDTAICGYEIHMGQTGGPSAMQPFQIEQRSDQSCSDLDGSLSADGNVLGTYIHGLFHNDNLRRAILRELAERKGKTLSAMTASFSVEEQYSRLAAHVHGSLNMDLILDGFRLTRLPVCCSELVNPSQLVAYEHGWSIRKCFSGLSKWRSFHNGPQLIPPHSWHRQNYGKTALDKRHPRLGFCP